MEPEGKQVKSATLLDVSTFLTLTATQCLTYDPDVKSNSQREAHPGGLVVVVVADGAGGAGLVPREVHQRQQAQIRGPLLLLSRLLVAVNAAAQQLLVLRRRVILTAGAKAHQLHHSAFPEQSSLSALVACLSTNTTDTAVL